MNLEKKYIQYETGKHDVAHDIILSPVSKFKCLKHFLKHVGSTTMNTITSSILMENSENMGKAVQCWMLGNDEQSHALIKMFLISPPILFSVPGQLDCSHCETV